MKNALIRQKRAVGGRILETAPSENDDDKISISN